MGISKLKFKILLILILSCISFDINLFAQDANHSISLLKNELESFRYKNVIEHADSIILHSDILSRPTLIEIYRMKATAQFSLSDIEGTKITFLNILNIDTTHTLDPSNTSPKIITFFNQVRHDYLAELSMQKRTLKVKPDTVVIHDVTASLLLKQAAIRSILFPGLGHFYLDQNIKGIALSSLSAVALSSTIYFIIESNNKQKDYLNARDPLLIQTKYNEYNTSYKLRNISIFALAAVWIYTQIDLLFLSGNTLPVLSATGSYQSNYLHMNFQIAL
jgi:hypothetical protein